MDNSLINFIEYKIITHSNIAIFFFDVKKDLPTPFQWTCAKEDFKQSNIDLYFIKMGDVEFDNKYASILDLLFTYPKEYIQQQLLKYTLI